MISSRGRKVRDEVEQLSDKYFYASWECLEKEDFQTLENLLKLLINGLT